MIWSQGAGTVELTPLLYLNYCMELLSKIDNGLQKRSLTAEYA